MEKPFRIVNMSFDVMQGVVLQLREENSASYSWVAGDAEAIENAPDTNLPSAFVVAVPSAVSYDSRAVATNDGDTVYNLVLMWAPYENAFVNDGGQFEIRFKLSIDSEWRPSFYVSGDFTAADIPSTAPDTDYDLQIRAINVVGARSNWVTILNARIGSTGGVITALDYGDFTTAPSTFLDYGDFTTPPSVFVDYGTF